MKQKRNSGITLVALVVTIVVLLILAGVSINMVLGNNGLITKAKEARNKTEQAQINTELALNNLYDEMIGILGQLPSTDYTTPYLPTGFSQVAGTNLSNGLVIQDGSGNQYVWVEVPKNLYDNSAYNTETQTADKKPSSSIEYDKIEYCLQKYTSTYRNGTRYTDTYYADSNNTGWFADATEYNTAKNNMLKSVYENGGFYVGRYETGIAYDDANGPRNYGTDNTTLHETTQTPVIKANAYPYNWVRRTQAKVLADNMESGDRTSSLMFGVQWDLVLAYMYNSGRVADSTLISDSTTIGNYYDNPWNVTNASAKWWNSSARTWIYCPKDKESSSTSILLSTGANTNFGIMNIYDIAGNVWEWTLEKNPDTSYPCGRGGYCGISGSEQTASHRFSRSTTYSDGVSGFRVSLY